MPVENRPTRFVPHGEVVVVPLVDSFTRMASDIVESIADPVITHVVIGDRAPLGLESPPDGRTVVAALTPMTDAIKRVHECTVVETVDRNQLRVVGPPLVLAADLCRRWAKARPDLESAPSPSEPGRRSMLEALLSQLVLVEPDLRVVPLAHIS